MTTSGGALGAFVHGALVHGVELGLEGGVAGAALPGPRVEVDRGHPYAGSHQAEDEEAQRHPGERLPAVARHETVKGHDADQRM